MWQSQKKCERCEKREMSGALDAPHLTAFYAREELQIKAQTAPVSSDVLTRTLTSQKQEAIFENKNNAMVTGKV